jgi:hypothetical protein
MPRNPGAASWTTKPWRPVDLPCPLSIPLTQRLSGRYHPVPDRETAKTVACTLFVSVSTPALEHNKSTHMARAKRTLLDSGDLLGPPMLQGQYPAFVDKF